MSKILIVAAHPDDEVLGCGATVVRLAKEGNEIYCLTLSKGVSSRMPKEYRDKGMTLSDVDKTLYFNALQIEVLDQARKKAAGIMGIKETFIHDFPDNEFDSISLLNIVQVVENFIDRIQPEIIFTHSPGDLNIDHHLTYKVVLTATRPIPGQTVKEIYTFEVPSSSEWSFNYAFRPNVFYNVTDTICDKVRALECYESEVREFPHPRSSEAIYSIAKRWGSVIGCEYAEGFMLVRSVR